MVVETRETPPLEHRRPPPGLTDIDPLDLGISDNALNIIGSSLDISNKLPGLVKHESTALLLDINNLYRRADDNGFAIDYGRLKSIFETRCDLRHCSAFSAVDQTDPKARKWVSFMENKGYTLVVKDLKRYTNNRGQRVSKGNMDIEIAIAALSLSQAFGHIIIGTCDGDFVPLIDKLREGHFRKVSVLGITNTDWTGMSDTLVHSADNFYDMAQIKEHIWYKGPRND